MWIGMSGQRGVGKTVACNYLVSKYKFKYIEFAGKLKDIANDLFEIKSKDLVPARKEAPLEHLSSKATPRDIYLALGQLGRYFDSDCWIKVALRKHDPSENLVVDGVRFLNEVDYIKDHSGKLIRLERYAKDNPYKGDILDSSEHELDDYPLFDFKIHEFENKKLNDLYTKLDQVMEDINNAGSY